MKSYGPVIVIEDDLNVQAALNYLNDTEVILLLILSDINMAKLDGVALRNKIEMDAKLQLEMYSLFFMQ